MTAIVTDFQPGDEAGAYYVCLKTGDHGADGEHLYRDDPDALGRIFVGPYLQFEPALALILRDDEGVCGYALGALDSIAFYDRYEREWRPSLVARFPEPQGDPTKWTHARMVHQAYHHPEYFQPEPRDIYPSHVHIDLLPRVQRHGHGRAMMNALLDRLRASGSPGVYLGLNGRNDKAHRFYEALAFTELVRRTEGEDMIIYMGRRL